MRHFILGIFLSFVLLGQAFAGETKTFDLLDGSIITGEIISYNDGPFVQEKTGGFQEMRFWPFRRR